MSAASTTALRVGAGALIGLLALQLVWHAGLAPTSRAALALSVLPLVPGIWIALRRLRRGVLIGAIACLFYFGHGVATVWGDVDLRAWAALEIALSVAVFAALYCDLRQHRGTRPDAANV